MKPSGVRFRFVLPMVIGIPVLVSAATKVWDGRGSNFFWTNPTNWVDDIAPSPGDDLVFPNSVRVFPSNDFPPGTAFNSILVTGFEYGLSGNLIALNAGLTNGLFYTLVTIPIRLGANQTFFASANTSTSMEFRGSSIDLNGFDLTISGPASVLISSSITGAGSLIQRTSRALYLAGSNTFTGPLRIDSGTLIVQHAFALGAAAGPTELGPNGILSVQTGNAFMESLILAGGSRLVGGTWNGPITLTGTNAEITGSVILNGPITGSGGILYNSGGNILTLTGANAYTGSNVIESGILIVNGQQPASDVFLKSGSSLQGTGRVGRIISTGGQIQPGIRAVGNLTCGDLILDENARLFLGGRYGLNVHGTVSLGNAYLNLSSFVVPGDKLFTIINNDGSDPINGTFGDLPEGEILSASTGNKLRITYVGGDGNDVVLLAVPFPPAPTGATRIWDGGGPNNRWSTPENWVGDIAPVQGDDLEFPNAAAQKTSVNDFPDGTAFNHLNFTGSGYRLEGMRVDLTAGILATDSSGANEVALPILLNSDQIFRTYGVLRLLSPINTAGSQLSFAGTGSIEVSGTISGTGGIKKFDTGALTLLNSNSYSGTTEVLQGELIISNSMALGSAKAETIVSSTLSVYTDTAEPIRVIGTLRSLGESASTTNTLRAPLTLPNWPNTGQLQVSNVLVLDAAPGTGAFQKLGAGTLVVNGSISGPNPNATACYISNGTFIVNGNFTSATAYLGNGTIGGTGRLYSIIAPETSAAANRVVSPGLDQPAILSVSDFLLLRNLATTAPAKLAIQLNGTRPGIEYDQIRAENLVNVNNARLEISLGFTPAHGDRFVIIDTTYGTQGRFLGLRQGAVFMVGDTQFQISYRGGDGNDVELKVTQGLSLTRTWDGGGNNGYWSNPQNWVDDIAPSPGETLFFPNSLALRTMTTNDFPAGTEFTLIAIDGRFQLHGAPITMDVGLLAYETATVDLPITLLTNITFVCEKDVYATNPIIDFRGGIDLAGHDLLLSNSGPIRVRGQLGPGNLVKAGRGLVELYTNNLHWLTQVLEGELAVYHNDALAAPDFATEVSALARVTLAGSNLTIAEPLTLAGTLASVGTLVFPWITNRWTGDITLQGQQGVISVSNSTRPLLITGLIQGPSDLVKLGDAPLLLMADNTYTGSTILSNGVLSIHGHQPQTPVYLRGGTLLGRGEVGDIFATNLVTVRVDPGNGPLFSTIDTATLACRNLIASSNALMGFTLAGPLAGVERDQLQAAGTVSLQGCRLDLRTLFRPEVSDSFVLIDNDGQDPVAGAFRGIPEGALFVQSNMLFRISYAGGDGNDVTVTRIAAPASTINSVGRQSNSIVLNGLGISNLTYTVQAATNLNAPIFWETIGTSSANRSNIYQFIDTNNSSDMRFYRALSP